MHISSGVGDLDTVGSGSMIYMPYFKNQKWNNLDLDQVRQLGVWLKWAEFWCEHRNGKDEPFKLWAVEACKLAQVQSDLRQIYEERTGAPPRPPEGIYPSMPHIPVSPG